jgi:hypothetical protein
MQKVINKPNIAGATIPRSAKTAVAKAAAKMNGYPAFATGNAVCPGGSDQTNSFIDRTFFREAFLEEPSFGRILLRKPF